jgi:hypothetical protein
MSYSPQEKWMKKPATFSRDVHVPIGLDFKDGIRVHGFHISGEEPGRRWKVTIEVPNPQVEVDCRPRNYRQVLSVDLAQLLASLVAEGATTSNPPALACAPSR